MPSPSPASRQHRSPKDTTSRRWQLGRWAVVLLAVLGLHWSAGQWLEHSRIGFEPPAAPPPVQIALLKPERIERQPVSPPSLSTSTSARKPVRPRSNTSTLSATPSTAKPTASAPETKAHADTSTSDQTSETGTTTGTATGSASNPHNPTASAAKAEPGVKFSVPPSGNLEYDSYYNGVRNPPGTIRWSTDGHQYRIAISIPLPFVGTYQYSSHGQIDAFGLAPEQYIEKRGRRVEDITIFNRREQQIVFTRTPTRLALPDGAQDRFSMLMQLSALVRGDPDAYQPGVTREFYVTDSDSGEIWPIQTIGDETIRTAEGLLHARHFRRLPRRADDTRRIDIWLAPSLGWLPARLMQTEPNGAEIELVWRGQSTAAGANADSAPASIRSPDPAAVSPDSLYNRP
ncbi:DUF3108 domain-containing protein [Paraburkholderia bonniea]|uniref:DUF3108 domain-containing protein n=1 Tax=Paraburkholderia bonniea TaxID=2152891 RepID=UPI002572F90B|nr:DUF3108 domain-containing protein [Paraburkholderia bonniea]WJF90080.1 DUF3108 domain-containing protein [Paraburkholderia bonniea]WJF93394.1 DUF3108 domain-containing protein [Paraburkholderia bonniea]